MRFGTPDPATLHTSTGAAMRGRGLTLLALVALLAACGGIESSAGSTKASASVPACESPPVELTRFKPDDAVFSTTISLRPSPGFATGQTGEMTSGARLIIVGGPIERDCTTWYRIMGILEPPNTDPTTLPVGWIPILDPEAGVTLAAEEVDCGEPPLDAMELSSLERRMSGPACYGHQPVPLIGFIAPTCGIDVHRVWLGEPEWINGQDAGTAIDDRELVDYEGSGLAFGPPGSELMRCVTPSGWYELTGHFADAAADSCETAIVHGSLQTRLDPVMSRQFCRSHYVVTASRRTGPPATPGPSPS